VADANSLADFVSCLYSFTDTYGGDNYNLKSHQYVCITYQPHNKSNPNPNPNPNHTTKQHAIVNIHLNKVTCLRI